MTPPGGAAFPERMKANKVIAGKVCGHCGKAITLGEDVFNCQKCQASMHLACHEKSGHCANPQCEDAAPARLAQAAPMPLAGAAGAPAIQPLPGHAPLTLRKPAGPAASAGGPPPASAAAVAASGGKGYLPVGMKECRFCGETIRQNARKCRFCGEYQLDIDRTSKSVQFEDPDDKLQVGWIIFALLPCGWICCIIGLIWGIMGKKKGWKLLAIAFIAQIVWGVISMIFGETGGGYGGY
jgi:hypothetical protein